MTSRWRRLRIGAGVVVAKALLEVVRTTRAMAIGSGDAIRPHGHARSGARRRRWSPSRCRARRGRARWRCGRRGARLLRGSNVHQRSPRYASNQAQKSIGEVGGGTSDVGQVRRTRNAPGCSSARQNVTARCAKSRHTPVPRRAAHRAPSCSESSCRTRTSAHRARSRRSLERAPQPGSVLAEPLPRFVG